MHPAMDPGQAQRSFWARMKERLWPPEEAEFDQAVVGEAPRRALRLDTAYGIRIAVRLRARNFNDARVAADGLKAGQQQIVNLEAAEGQMAERVLDFLSGVAYAMDGSVERITEKVYLFTPANVEVEVDTDGGAQPR